MICLNVYLEGIWKAGFDYSPLILCLWSVWFSETGEGARSTNIGKPVLPLLMAVVQSPQLWLRKSISVMQARVAYGRIHLGIFFYFLFFFVNGKESLLHPASICGLHTRAYWAFCYRGGTAGCFPCQKTRNFWGLFFSNGSSIWGKNPTLFGVCVCFEEGVSCSIPCLFLLSQFSGDIGIQGSSP